MDKKELLQKLQQIKESLREMMEKKNRHTIEEAKTNQEESNKAI